MINNKMEEGFEPDFTMLKEKYPGVSMEKLNSQSFEYATDDGCIHYMDLNTKIIYSWNYLEKFWEIQNEKAQKELKCLFK